MLIRYICPERSLGITWKCCFRNVLYHTSTSKKLYNSSHSGICASWKYGMQTLVAQ